jgi:citrate lyase subunit beta / citryl-CoA lyase
VAPRSYLFVPGNRPDRFEKARSSGADAVILDLEDAVSVEEKPAAREIVASWLSPERPVYVRVNGTQTEWFANDLRAVSRPGIAGIMLPKAEEPEQVAETRRGLSDGTPVLPTLETALGVWNARALAEAPGVERLAFGPVDFRLDTGILGEGEELLYIKTRMVLASRVAGVLPPLDGVTVALDDPEQLAADVQRARSLGFGGKVCIHPRQVGAVNEGFLPTQDEVTWAEKVVWAAETAGSGAIRLSGEFIDPPVVERARAILEQMDR